MSLEHRSRRPWPAPVAASSARPRSSLLIVYVAIVLLTVAVAVLTAYIVVLKNARDTEQQRIDQRINTSTCDLLDQLPAGGLLERPRRKYHCGPGLPSTSPAPEPKEIP